MTEVDRLKRELKSEIAKREELQRASQTQKEKVEALHAENAILTNAKTMDENMIKRRDRKLEEFKAELSVEKQKRECLEARVQESERRREEQEQKGNEQLQRLMEEAKLASTSAAIYQTSHKQLKEEYAQRIASSHKQLRELYDKREEDLRLRDTDRRKMVKIDVVNGQMCQELEKTRKAYAEMFASQEQYRRQKDAEVEDLAKELEVLRENDRRRERDFSAEMEEMRETVGRMKWVMAVKKMADENGIHSPPPSPPG